MLRWVWDEVDGVRTASRAFPGVFWPLRLHLSRSSGAASAGQGGLNFTGLARVRWTRPFRARGRMCSEEAVSRGLAKLSLVPSAGGLVRPLESLVPSSPALGSLHRTRDAGHCPLPPPTPLSPLSIQPWLRSSCPVRVRANAEFCQRERNPSQGGRQSLGNLEFVSQVTGCMH